MLPTKRIPQFLFRKSSNLLNKIRTRYYRIIFEKMGKKSTIGGRVRVYCPEHVRIGDHCTINEGCILNALGSLTIGNHVHISPCVIINTGYLDYHETGAKREHIKEAVVIKDGAWLCSGSIINPGVTIGKNAVIAAGSVVTKDVPDNVLAAGVPAAIKRKIAG